MEEEKNYISINAKTVWIFLFFVIGIMALIVMGNNYRIMPKSFMERLETGDHIIIPREFGGYLVVSEGQLQNMLVQAQTDTINNLVSQINQGITDFPLDEEKSRFMRCNIYENK